MTVGIILGITWLLIGLPGCSLGTSTAPPTLPVLPAIRYVPACDPEAVLGLTQEDVEGLRERDQMWQRHVAQLEQQLQQRSHPLSLPTLP